jgi:hypothetical protein
LFKKSTKFFGGVFLKNSQQDQQLNNAQQQLKQVQQLAQQLQSKTEFAGELTNLQKLQQYAQQAEKEVQNARNQNK